MKACAVVGAVQAAVKPSEARAARMKERQLNTSDQYKAVEINSGDTLV